MRIRTLGCRETTEEDERHIPRIMKYPLNDSQDGSIDFCDYAWHRGIILVNKELCISRACTQHKIAIIEKLANEGEQPKLGGEIPQLRVLRFSPEQDGQERYIPYCSKHKAIISSQTKTCKVHACPNFKKAYLRKVDY
jgi:hypothetical protein